MRVALVVLLALSCGCSFLAVTPPRSPSEPRSEVPLGRTCTESAVAPTIDTFLGSGTVIAGFVFTGMVSALSHMCISEHCDEPSTTPVVLTALTFAAAATLFYGSAYYGFTRTTKCRESRGP